MPAPRRDNMADEQAKRDELIRLLTGVPAEAAKLASVGSDLIQAAQISSDVASPLLEIVRKLPGDCLVSGKLDSDIAAWRSWHDAASKVQGAKTTVNTFVVAASGALNTAVSGVSVHFTPPLMADHQAVIAARTTLFETVNRSPLIARLRGAMTRVGLDKREVTTAPPWTCSKRQPGRWNGLPSPLRGAIEVSISELLRRRPVKEPTPKWADKVASIGRHCGHSFLPPSHFSSLCATIDPLWSQLSGAKQDDLTREEVAALFGQGIAFLTALMDGVDESVLKP
jgi:hypothetical protein